MSARPSVLVVCTGNICRSPLGEAALRARLEGAVVTSAGTDARDGGPATEGSRIAGAERGLDIAQGRPQVGQRAVLDRATVIADPQHPAGDGLAEGVALGFGVHDHQPLIAADRNSIRSSSDSDKPI